MGSKSNAKDLVGERFGRLIVIKREGSNKQHRATWLCRCECGNEKIIVGHDLQNGTKSCGCLHKEVLLKNFEKGREKRRTSNIKTNIYNDKENYRLARIHSKMKSRCYNPNDTNYRKYGGRGIRICKEWLEDYQVFKKWALNNGYNMNLTIDRINVNGNYEPNNCRWANLKDQANNKRTNHFLEIGGETKTIAQWSEITGTKTRTISCRLIRGWEPERAIKPPKRRDKNV